MITLRNIHHNNDTWVSETTQLLSERSTIRMTHRFRNYTITLRNIHHNNDTWVSETTQLLSETSTITMTYRFRNLQL